MLEILGITMRNGECYRISVKGTDAMNKAWLAIVNKNSDTPMTFEEAMRESCYLSNDKGYLIMEIEADLDQDHYRVMFYFDDYETIEVEVSEEEKKQLADFINERRDKIPDNDKLLLDDGKYQKLLFDEFPWNMDMSPIRNITP